MRLKRLCNMALGFVFLACTLPAGLAAQTTSADTDQKIADLEKQLAGDSLGTGCTENPSRLLLPLPHPPQLRQPAQQPQRRRIRWPESPAFSAA